MSSLAPRGIPERLRAWVRDFQAAHPAAEVVAVRGERTIIVRLCTTRKLYEVEAAGEPKRSVFTAV